MLLKVFRGGLQNFWSFHAMIRKWNMEYFSSPDGCLQLPEPIFVLGTSRSNYCCDHKLLLWFDFCHTCRSFAPGYTAFAITATVHRLSVLEQFCVLLFSESWSAEEHAALGGQEGRTNWLYSWSSHETVSWALFPRHPYPVKSRLNDVMIICHCLSVAALT